MLLEGVLISNSGSSCKLAVLKSGNEEHEVWCSKQNLTTFKKLVDDIKGTPKDTKCKFEFLSKAKEPNKYWVGDKTTFTRINET
jgi:hypothetical protein